jgi:hypothetical protein
MAQPITYKRLVLSGDKAKATADEVKIKMSKEWKKDFPDGKLDIKAGVDGKMVIDIKTKESSAASLASKIKDIATRNKVTTVTKDKPTLKAVKENLGLKEALDKRLATIFFKYKDKSFPMSYEPRSEFSKFITDLGDTGYFSTEDELSDFMASEEFDTYANRFNVEIDYADYDPSQLEIPDEEEINPQDMIPGRAPSNNNFDIPHRVTDLMEKLKRTGKLKKSELKEILLFEYKKK